MGKEVKREDLFRKKLGVIRCPKLKENVIGAILMACFREEIVENGGYSTKATRVGLI